MSIFQKPDRHHLIVTSAVLVWIFIVNVAAVALGIAGWPLFFVTIFFFALGADMKNIPSIFVGGTLGLVAALALYMGTFGLASSLAATGLLILGICASIFPAVYIEAPMDKEWVRAYSGLSGFLMTNNLCWLFWLLCLTLAGGLAALFRPRLQPLFGRLRHRLAHRQPSQPPAEE